MTITLLVKTLFRVIGRQRQRSIYFKPFITCLLTPFLITPFEKKHRGTPTSRQSLPSTCKGRVDDRRSSSNFIYYCRLEYGNTLRIPVSLTTTVRLTSYLPNTHVLVITLFCLFKRSTSSHGTGTGTDGRRLVPVRTLSGSS